MTQDLNIERMSVSEQQQEYISIDEAATALGVSRTNLYYYARQLSIELKKFALDRKTYISRVDIERIKAAKGVGASSTRIASEDVLVLLAGLGLAVTPHSDPSRGWGYAWYGGDWEGPYDSPIDAIRGAFVTADKKAQRLREMPFPTRAGELFWWDGEAWFTARHKNGTLEVFTMNSAENEGYESVADVMARREAWLQPAERTGDEKVDEERERARLAALWLAAGLSELQYVVEPIDWQHSGLEAEVIVNSTAIGGLQSVYNRYREDDFVGWLRTRLANRSSAQ